MKCSRSEIFTEVVDVDVNNAQVRADARLERLFTCHTL